MFHDIERREERDHRDIERVEEVLLINEMFDDEQPRKKKCYRARVNPFELYSDAEFRRKYRFSKQGAQTLINMFGLQLQSDTKRGGKLSPEIQMLTALRCWGRNEMQDDCADLHGMSQQSLTNVCRRVALCIVEKRETYINMPQTLEAEVKITSMFSAICGFKSVIGCIDCTHIRIPHIKGDQGHYFINRKNFPSLNVQVVCDSTLKIMDIVARWYGSAHDSRIFNESSLKQRFEDRQFHGRLLGDSGYACTPYLFTPVVNPRTRKEERYNEKHVKTRNTVERCFGVWKSRFRCLQTGFRNSLDNTKLYGALAILHNLAVIFKEEEFPVEEVIEEDNLLPIVAAVGRGAAVRAVFIEDNF